MAGPGDNVHWVRLAAARIHRRRLAWATVVSVLIHAAPILALVNWPPIEREPDEPLVLVSIERLEIEDERPVENARVEAERPVFVEKESSARQTGRAEVVGVEVVAVAMPAQSVEEDRELSIRDQRRRTDEPESSEEPRREPREESRPEEIAMRPRHSQEIRPSSALSVEADVGVEAAMPGGLRPAAASSRRQEESEESPEARNGAEPAREPSARAEEGPRVENESPAPEPAQEEADDLAEASWVERLARRGGISAPAGESSDLLGERVDDLDYAEMARLRARQASMDLYLLEVRRRIEPHWQPRFALSGRHADEVAEILFSRGGRSLTKVAVRLDARGEVRELQVSTSSGLVQLDEHALDAFRKAAPFPPPPRHLLEGGELAFEWGARARY